MATNAGPFWEKKLLSLARRINLAGDSLPSKQDFEGIADRYNALTDPTPLRAKQLRRKTVGLWTDFFSKDAANDKVDEATFISCLRARKDKLFQVGLLFFDKWFDAIDHTGDGVIDKDQYAVFLKALMRIEDKAAAYESFNKLDGDGDGKVSYEEFIRSAVGFFISDDESSPSGTFLGPLI